MSRKKKKVPDTIDPNEIPVRDELMVLLINGATKSGVQVDRKKEASRKGARKKVKLDDEEQ